MSSSVLVFSLYMSSAGRLRLFPTMSITSLASSCSTTYTQTGFHLVPAVPVAVPEAPLKGGPPSFRFRGLLPDAAFIQVFGDLAMGGWIHGLFIGHPDMTIYIYIYICETITSSLKKPHPHRDTSPTSTSYTNSTGDQIYPCTQRAW